jgi:hypothetical protein
LTISLCLECNKWIDHYLHEASFTVYVYDLDLYIFMESNLVLLLVIYVDDVMITLSHTTKINLVMELCKSFDMTIVGCLALYMGIQFVYMRIAMAYECYIYKSFHNLSLTYCFSVSIHMDPSTKLTVNMATPLNDATYYNIFKICKSHISFFFGLISQLMSFLHELHLGIVLHIFHYLKVLRFTINKGN